MMRLVIISLYHFISSPILLMLNYSSLTVVLQASTATYRDPLLKYLLHLLHDPVIKLVTSSIG